MIALLKKFVNSTIGTASSKPLDVMISEKSAIKSIQRGTVAGASATSITDKAIIDIAISTVDQSKCMVLINGGYGYYVGGNATPFPYLTSVSNTTISINRGWVYSSSTYYSATFSWQVIEYY